MPRVRPRPVARAVAERCLGAAARALWPVAQRFARRFARPPIWPDWAPSPLVRSAESTAPPQGWPRQTDSLCPECTKELRREVLEGRRSVSALLGGGPAHIKADIIERGGQVVMTKRCPTHGVFEEVLSIDPEFLARIEQRFTGRDYEAEAGNLRSHGSSSIKYGRGSVLTVDLTNRCNLHCDPCFMDAGQPGCVCEPAWSEIKRILDDCLTVRPRRQMSVQFSGGEPTLSPHFLDAIRYAREIGYFCVQCASNGVRFAQEPEFCHQAKAAGLRLCYLQFDGVSNDAYEHRHVANQFEVKSRAIDNLHAAGVDVVLVPTIVNGQNSDQVGEIVKFAVEHAHQVTVVSFQPVSFAGRCEDISDDDRKAQRYTLSHLAHDLKSQLGVTEPLRDWYPLAAMNPFSDLADLLLGPAAQFGALKCGCHPHCGIGTVLLVHKTSKQMVPVAQFIDLDQLLADLKAITDAGLGRRLTLAQVALALLRNFHSERAPAGYGLTELLPQLLSQIGASGRRIGETEGDADTFDWRFLFVAGMWFQDLYTYDFRRTEMCIIPYGTPLGEISFCAYNTGVGWRYVVEKLAKTPTLADLRPNGKSHPLDADRRGLRLADSPQERVSGPDEARKRLPVLG